MYILGLSGGFGHDAAACLVHNGKLIAMIEEERLVRIKKALGLAPIKATFHCLAEAGITIEDVDCIALSWTPDSDPAAYNSNNVVQSFINHEAFRGYKLPPIKIVDHHLSHAAAAFYSSGFDSASVLVIDGHGDGVSITSGYGKRDAVSLDYHRYGIEHSLGNFYSCATRHLGLGNGAEGKFMGLAAYGKPVYDIPVIQLTEDGFDIDVSKLPAEYTLTRYFHTRRFWEGWFEKEFGSPLILAQSLDAFSRTLHQKLPFTNKHQNFAASIQKKLEEVVTHLVKIIVKRSGYKNVVLAGGVSLNCSLNSAICALDFVDDVYIFPPTNDAGGCLGAALEIYRKSNHFQPQQIQNADWGPKYEDSDIYDLLKNLKIKFTQPTDIESTVASLLARNYVVGWFQGRSEVGPRALGQRSILANPASPTMQDHINNTIKNREPWRPFAPSILAEYAEEYLHTNGIHSSPFMLRTYDVKEDKKAIVPAIVHVDGTTRPQTVDRIINSCYWRLIDAFRQSTGIPMVLNTSFNVAGEPIVCSPIDAIRTFYGCGLDALVVNKFLIMK